MIRIIPAILEHDLDQVKRKLDMAAAFAKQVHIDIADGVFVPNRTAQIAQVVEIAQSLALEIEWHLMVSQPLNNLPSKKSTVIFHFEAVNDPGKTAEEIKKLGHTVGIALNPETSAASIGRLVNLVDLVTVMAVEPGWQGSPFVAASLQKIKELKARYPRLKVEIDGGVNETNFADVLASGVDQVVIGSGLWKTPNPQGEYQKLTQLGKAVL